MALNANELGAEIAQRIEDARSEIVALFVNGQILDGQTKIWSLVAAAIIDHLKANAEITPDGTPAMTAGGDPVTGKARIS